MSYVFLSYGIFAFVCGLIHYGVYRNPEMMAKEPSVGAWFSVGFIYTVLLPVAFVFDFEPQWTELIVVPTIVLIPAIFPVLTPFWIWAQPLLLAHKFYLHLRIGRYCARL